MIYLNGNFLSIEDAVIPVYSRHPFRLAGHLQRLQKSLESIRLDNPHSEDEWRKLIESVIDLNKAEDQSLYLQVTRGVAERDHAFPEKTVPTVLITSNPLSAPRDEQTQNGVGVITATDNRWLRCDVKSTALLPNVLLRQLSVDAGCVETLLVRDGLLTEGSASNAFVVKAGVMLTPPKSNLMLTGITYDVVLEIAQANGIAHEVRNIKQAELDDADEIWITSSSKEILPVTTLNGRPVGNGKPGPLFQRMHDLFQAYKVQVMRAPS